MFQNWNVVKLPFSGYFYILCSLYDRIECEYHTLWFDIQIVVTERKHLIYLFISTTEH